MPKVFIGIDYVLVLATLLHLLNHIYGFMSMLIESNGIFFLSSFSISDGT